MDVIADYLTRTALEPFEWGKNDCALWAAGLVLYATGHDPAAGLRGTYSTAWGARKIVMQHGGMMNLARSFMAGYRAGEERAGVAVVEHGGRRICCVLQGGRPMLKTETGVIMPERFKILEGWSWR